MKKTLSILLLFSLVFQCLGCLGVFAWYGANKQRIVNELCENRNRPELHCNGQCVLMKKLKVLEDDETNGTGDDHANPNTETVVFLLPEPFVIRMPAACDAAAPISPEVCYHYLYATDNFRPPNLTVLTHITK